MKSNKFDFVFPPDFDSNRPSMQKPINIASPTASSKAPTTKDLPNSASAAAGV